MDSCSDNLLLSFKTATSFHFHQIGSFYRLHLLHRHHFHCPHQYRVLLPLCRPSSAPFTHIIVIVPSCLAVLLQHSVIIFPPSTSQFQAPTCLLDCLHVYSIVYTFIRVSKRLFDCPSCYSVVQTFIQFPKCLFNSLHVYSIPQTFIQFPTHLFNSLNVYPVLHTFTRLSTRLLGQSHVYQTSFTFSRSVPSI